MKRRAKINKITSVLLLQSSTFLILPILCSCSPTSPITPEPEKEDLLLVKTEFVVDIKNFSVPILVSNNISQDDITVEIINVESQIISLVSKDVKIVEGSGNIGITIDNSIVSDFNIKFGLKICYKKNDEIKTKEFLDLNLFYFNQLPEEEIIRVPTKSLSNTDLRHFDFDFYVSIPPKDMNVELVLDSYFSNIISLTNNISEVQPYSALYKGSFGIDVANYLIEDKSFNFNIAFRFADLDGNIRNIKIPNFSVTLNFNRTETVPSDYFDIRSESGKNVLYGLKPGLNPLESGRYRYLIIPDTVNQIKTNAFTDTAWFDKIRFITIPNSIESIGKNAFSGCSKALEIDLKSYSSIPKWIVNATEPIFAISTFSVAGYVWTHNIKDVSDIEQKLSTIGLNDEWMVCDDKLIMPEDTFILTSDKKTLQKIDPEKENLLYFYKIIRIPESVVEIDPNAFKILQDIPYIHYQDEKPAVLETRRLILNRKLKFISRGTFENCGIGGPIFFYCKKLLSIQNEAFQNAQHFVDIEESIYTREKLQLVFDDCFELNGIETRAFNMASVDVDEFYIPNNVDTISEWAFQGNKIKKIIFPKKTKILEPWCFANDYQTPFSKNLTCIDLSNYNVIQNPTQKEEEQTYFPIWFILNDYAFIGSCAEQGTVLLSQECWDEAHEDDGWDYWVSDFITMHGIPSTWTFEKK